ncbi:MAG: hypothetical protein NG740_07270 [Omnitrophica bacterium]|nr:hypothetical protein [Candidatus Omnitrophota bacterium]
MKKNISKIATAGIALAIAIAVVTCASIFNTDFARNTIDYFSFFAAIFLIVDGFYKINHYRNEPYFPNQLIRHFRIIIGSCVFTIHVMQYIYGV